MVVEASSICAGATGFTTGKVTSQHSLIYAALEKRQGADQTRVFAQAQQAAIERIVAIAHNESIECDIRRATAFVYTEDSDKESEFAEELEAALRCGLPARRAAGDIGLPWEVEDAIAFANQVAFHPRRYCLGLAGQIVRRGGVLRPGRDAHSSPRRRPRARTRRRGSR